MADNKRKRGSEDNGGDRSEVERYRQAATEALEMVDWCIGYLVGTRKESIAAQLAQNRAHLRKQLMHEPEEPLPTEKE